MDRNLQLLGIAKKAGLLAIGGESASASAKSGRARAIITARDASEGAKRRAQRDAEFCGAAFAVTHYTKFEFGSVTGRGSPGTLAVMDAGLAAGFLKSLAEDDPERYGAAARDAALMAETMRTPYRTGKTPAADKPRGGRNKTAGKRRTAK